MNKRILISHIVFGFMVMAGFETSQAAAPASAPATAPAQTPAAKPASPDAPRDTPLYKSYVYYGDRYRDPFIPLNGDIRSDLTANERPPQVSSLVLKGIVQDAKGRMALLNSGLNSYILKGGRLYDGRNRMVKKIAGVIKTDSVVIIGSDRTVVELKTKAPL